MKTVSLKRSADHVTVVPTLWVAHTLWERTRGLLRRPPLKIGEGLLLQRCRSIHTIGMAYPLDIVFLDKNGIVRKCVTGVKTFRTVACFAANATLELPEGGLAEAKIEPGDQLYMVQSGGLPSAKTI